MNSLLGRPALFLDSLPFKMGPIYCPETSVRIYHYLLHNNPEERRSQVWVSLDGGFLLFFFCTLRHVAVSFARYLSSFRMKLLPSFSGQINKKNYVCWTLGTYVSEEHVAPFQNRKIRTSNLYLVCCKRRQRFLSETLVDVPVYYTTWSVKIKTGSVTAVRTLNTRMTSLFSFSVKQQDA
jgi:hypothetical protein